MITKKISFEQFLENKQGPIRQRTVYYDGFLFGHGMKVIDFQLCHNEEVICSCYGNDYGDIRFTKVFDAFMNEVASEPDIFMNIMDYAKHSSEAKRFTVISEEEYSKQLDNNQNQLKRFYNRNRFRWFVSNGKKFSISVNVNMCEQMEFFCSVIPEKERRNWFFVVTPTYESSQSSDFIKEVSDLDQKIKKDKNKSILELEKRFNSDRKVISKKTKKSEDEKKNSQDGLNKRNPDVVVISKLIAEGVCELSDMNGEFHAAPVFEGYGPYLEVHHIKWLSRRGTDTLDNVVALCPTCHRKMHILDDKADIAKLKKVASFHMKKWNMIVKKAKEKIE